MGRGGSGTRLNVLLEGNGIGCRAMFLRLSINGCRQADVTAKKIAGVEDMYMVSANLSSEINIVLLQMGRNMKNNTKQLAPNNHILDISTHTLLHIKWGRQLQRLGLAPGKQLMFILPGNDRVSLQGSIQPLGCWKEALDHYSMQLPRLGTLIAFPVDSKKKAIAFKLVRIRHLIRNDMTAEWIEWERPLQKNKTEHLHAVSELDVIVSRWGESAVYKTEVAVSKVGLRVKQTDKLLLDIMQENRETFLNVSRASEEDLLNSSTSENQNGSCLKGEDEEDDLVIAGSDKPGEDIFQAEIDALKAAKNADKTTAEITDETQTENTGAQKETAAEAHGKAKAETESDTGENIQKIHIEVETIIETAADVVVSPRSQQPVNENEDEAYTTAAEEELDTLDDATLNTHLQGEDGTNHVLDVITREYHQSQHASAPTLHDAADSDVEDNTVPSTSSVLSVPSDKKKSRLRKTGKAIKGFFNGKAIKGKAIKGLAKGSPIKGLLKGSSGKRKHGGKAMAI